MITYIYIYYLGTFFPLPPKKLEEDARKFQKKKKTTTTIEKGLSLSRNLYYVLATTY